jgi:hypothetical protein
MGEAGVAGADSADSLVWNAAGLAAVTGLDARVTYLMGFEGSTYQQVLGAYRLAGIGTLGVGVSLLQSGTLDLDQDDGTFRTIQGQNDLAFSLGYGAQLQEGLRAGGVIKHLRSSLLESYTASAWAVDAGLQADLGRGFQIGAALQNLGTEMVYASEGDPLPLTLRVGLGYAVALGEAHQLAIALDAVKQNDRELALHTGLEYQYAKMLSARLGYKAGYDAEGITLGLGVSWNALQFDYAFGLLQGFSGLHRLTLGVRM